MPAPIVPIAAHAAARPALAALTRALAAIEPMIAKVAEALARSAGRFKDFLAQALTTEKVLATIRKAMEFVSVADAAAKLGVALVGVKGKLAEIAAGFGLTGKPGGMPSAAAPLPAPAPVSAAAPAPAVEQVAVAVGDGGAAAAIRATGEEAAAAIPKIGSLGDALGNLMDGIEENAVVKAASSFDQLKLSLETLLGSAGHAGQAFEMLLDFAGRTPFTIESSTEAFRQLWEAGIKPTEENLNAFGNVAAAFGKDLTAVTSAISGVDLGKLDGLEQLGFQVQEQGNKLKVTFRGVTDTVGNSSREVAKYLEGLGKNRFADGMERQANTFASGFDSVDEALKRLRAGIGDKGLLPGLESMDASFARLLERAQPLADLVGEVLGKAMKGAAAAAKLLADHAGLVIPLLAGLSVATSTPSLGDFAKALGTAKTALTTLGQAILANPIGLIAGAIAAVVAALVIFKDETLTIGETSATVGEWLQATWDVTKEYLGVAWDALKSWFASFSDDMVMLWEYIRGRVLNGVQQIQALLARAFQFVADLVSGIGDLLGVGFSAIVGWLRDMANKALAVIFSIPEAFSTAKQALEEGDILGLFDRVRTATADNFSQDYVGQAFGAITEGIGNFASQVGEAVGAAAGKVKDWVVGIGRDFKELTQMFGSDVVARVKELVAARPRKQDQPGPPGRILPDDGDALGAVRKSVEEANAAFKELKAAPLAEVEARYKAFAKEAAEANEVIEQQRKILADLAKKSKAAAISLNELNNVQDELARKEKAAKSLLDVQKATESTAGALAKLEGASILDVQQAYQEFNVSIGAANETVQESQELFAGLCDQQGEAAAAIQALNAATEEMNKQQNAANAIINKHSKESLGAAKALNELKNATPQEAPAKAQAFRDEMEKLRTAIVEAEGALGKMAPGPEFDAARRKLLQMKDDFQVLGGAGEELGIKLGESTKEATDVMSQHFQGFVTGVTSAFDSALVDLFKGSTEGFEKLFDHIADMFAEMLAKMVSDWIKAQIFQQQAGTPGQQGGGVNFQAFADKNFGKGQYASAAAVGAGIGAYGSSALGGRSDTGAALGMAGSLVGQAIAVYALKGGAVAGFWGAVIGAVVGAVVAAFISQKPDIKGYAEVAVRDGKAVIDQIRTQGKADVQQLRKFAEGVADTINEIVALSGGALASLGKITLQTKDNKYYRVIDAAGITHKFGEDLKAATDYAVIQALKGAELEGLSPQVQAAFRNTMATTVEELASDIEFAAMVRDLDVEPATRSLRDLMKTFHDMAARAQALGISLEKVDEAFGRAFEDLKKDILSGLEPFKDAGLTDIEREAKHITETFKEMRDNARLFNEELDRQKQGRNQEITDLQEEVARQETLKAAAKRRQELFGGANPEDVLPPDLLERFPGLGRWFQGQSVEEIDAVIKKLEDEIKRLQGLNETQTPIDTGEIDDAEEKARERLHQRFEDELAAFAGENPFVAQLEVLWEQFEGLKKSAEAVGEATTRVDEAYQKALETMQKQFQEGIQSYLDYGRGLSDLNVRHRDLTKFFDEQREAARALDEALGSTGGGGPNERLLKEAEAAAFQQLVDEFNASLQDLRDAGLTPTEIAVRDMRDRFAQLREDAVLLGLSVDELTRLEVEAIERLRGELDAQLDRYLLSDEEQQQRAFDQEFLGYLRDAFALYTYEPGMDEPMEPEPFPGAHELERSFGELTTASDGVVLAFNTMQDAIMPDGTEVEDLLPPGTGPTPGEIVASVLDFLEPLREGRGMEDVPAEQKQAIDSAATQVSLLLEQLRLGMTDDVGALQVALGNLVGLLDQSGFEIDSSLLSLADALASGDIAGFLDDLRNGVIGSTDGFGALIDILLSGNVSLPDLMHQLANGTFDAIQAMLGLTELPADLAAALQKIGKAYEAGQQQQRPRQSRSTESRGSDASREIEQRERERESLLKQLEQYEDLALSPTARELKRLNEQFAEMEENARRLGIPLERVDAARQLAMDEQRRRVLSQLEPYEDLALTPLERELKTLDKQFDELRASAELLRIPLDQVEAAYQLALEDRRKQVVSQLEPYEDLALSPLERELKSLAKQFDELQASAELLDIPLDRVAAAYELALQQKKDALSDQLEQYEDLALSPVERELKQLNEQFEQMQADAELLGISMERVDAAYQLALEQQRKGLLDQLASYEEGALSPAEKELEQLNKQFEEMRANAILLGVSLDRVETAYQQAIEDFWERLLGPLQEFREGLALSELSTLTPEQRLAEAQARFDELTARALGGDLEAAQQLQGAAQQLLQEAQSFYASGEGYQNLFALVTGTIDQVLAALPGMFPQSPPPVHTAAEGFDGLLAQAGWGYQDSLAARGIPFGIFPGDTLGVEPVPGYRAEGGPALDVDLSCVREGNLALREELRLAREQEHVDAVELQKRVDQQSEELREVRALLRRLTSNTQYGGRAQ